MEWLTVNPSRYFHINDLVSINIVISLVHPTTLEHEDKVSLAIAMAIDCALLHTTTLYFQFNELFAFIMSWFHWWYACGVICYNNFSVLFSVTSKQVFMVLAWNAVQEHGHWNGIGREKFYFILPFFFAYSHHRNHYSVWCMCMSRFLSSFPFQPRCYRQLSSFHKNSLCNVCDFH